MCQFYLQSFYAPITHTHTLTHATTFEVARSHPENGERRTSRGKWKINYFLYVNKMVNLPFIFVPVYCVSNFDCRRPRPLRHSARLLSAVPLMHIDSDVPLLPFQPYRFPFT